MSHEISIKTFDELTSVDLYHILKARSQVFVVEQNCAYQDIDELDFDCLHLVAHQDERLIGYCRIIPPTSKMPQQSSIAYAAVGNVDPAATAVMPTIGSVLVLPKHRSHGLARDMMKQAIKYCQKHYRKKPIVISAQTYVISFYESLGFIVQGNVYLKHGLERVTMILHPYKKQKAEASSSTKMLMYLLTFLALLGIAGLAYLTL